jgi:hypothetical protein
MDASRDSLTAENNAVFEALHRARPRLIGVAAAKDAIPELGEGLILHAGPPIAWPQMQPAMRAAVLGGLVFEGGAANFEEAETLVSSGAMRFAPANDHHAAGAMAGIITGSMPVFIVEEELSGERAFVSINEGLRKALRFGANGPEVLARLVWIHDAFAPLLARALRRKGPIDLKLMVAEALRRGDECHNRNKAATAMFFREIASALVATEAPHADIVRALDFISGNDHFFLSLSIAHAKAVTLAMERLGIGSLVTTMAGNGREVGIRTSRTGKSWFTAPAEVAELRLFEGHALEDATPTMGDSYVTEVIGLGGFALAAAPAIAEFIGGKASDLAARSEMMRKIAVGEHPEFRIPALDFRGVPSGIDVLKVAETGITPMVNTGVASKRPGVGQIGAGTQSFPLACFTAAAAVLG